MGGSQSQSGFDVDLPLYSAVQVPDQTSPMWSLRTFTLSALLRGPIESGFYLPTDQREFVTSPIIWAFVLPWRPLTD
jgi:hypothetical protein